MEKLTKQYVKKYKKYYDIHNKYSLFHHTISLIISQKIKFTDGRKIRKSIFEYIKPDDEFTPKKLNDISEETYLNFGIDKQKYKCIIDVIKLFINNENYSDLDYIKKLEEITGIGIWTIKSLKIMKNLEEDLFLFEDLYIRKRLCELTNKKNITIKEANEMSIIWKPYRTIISKFLWRIKPCGIENILNDNKLVADDFV